MCQVYLLGSTRDVPSHDMRAHIPTDMGTDGEPSMYLQMCELTINKFYTELNDESVVFILDSLFALFSMLPRLHQHFLRHKNVSNHAIS